MRNVTEKKRTGWRIVVWVAILAAGCNHARPELTYLGEEQRQYYRGHATEIDYPTVASCPTDEVMSTAEPHTIRDQEETPIRDVTLQEAVQMALQNSHIIRRGGAFEQTGSSLVSNPNAVDSVYDPAIQESGVLFGGRGVEAALAAFDAQLRSSMFWSRSHALVNTAGFPANIRETGTFTSSLSKTFAYGGAVSVSHDINYLGTNRPGAGGFPSAYSGILDFQYRQPLLAGAGPEFTRIAGPIGQAFGGLTGVSQGVLISRINGDISITDFEIAVTNLVRDVENTYWDLYLAYRNYHTGVTAYESALLTWRIADLQLEGGVRTRAEVAQSRDQLFAAEAATENARSQIYTAEIKLRRLMGLPVNDGTTLRPIDEPVSAELVPDWYGSLSEALIQRVELRRQKWGIKSLELQLRAARSLVRPRLDFLGGYTVNGFGDDLLAYGSNGAIAASDNVNSFYQNLAGGDQTGWNMGVQLEMPLGLRSSKAQVRNYELRLAKAQKVLQESEKEISHELAVAFQELARSYSAAATNLNRLLAARENVKYLEPNIREGDKLLDDLLRAQERQAQAEVAYYQSLVEYNKALANLQYRKGSLLRHNGIVMAEGGWCPEAYQDAMRQYDARAHAHEARWQEAVPAEFASDYPVGGAYVAHPEPTPVFEAEQSTDSEPESSMLPEAPEPLSEPVIDEPVPKPEQPASETERYNPAPAHVPEETESIDDLMSWLH